MEVLIVAKTHMSQAFCIGAMELESKRNIRLLTSSGENQPINTDLNVGQIWNIEYTNRQTIIPPHYEDVLVSSKTYIREQQNLKNFLIDNANIWKGDQYSIFDGKIYHEIGRSGYFTIDHGLPSQSVGFWLPDKNLELTIFQDKKHYFYFGDTNDVFSIPYVGYGKPIEQIKKGSLVRVSLARWWKPNPSVDHKRCYCQLSGWYA